jgi:hypothetical protein
VTVAYRGSNTTASGFSTLADGVQITLAAPTGTVVGDLLVLTVTADGVPSTPSGWTLAGSGTTVGGPGLKVFYKIATSTEVSSGVTFRDVGASTDSMLGCLSGYTGADTTTPVTVSYGGSATASTSHVAPTLTPTVAGSYLHVAYTCRGGTFTHTTVTGMTEIADTTDSWINLAVDNLALSDTSATGTKTATSSTSSTYDSVSVLINAAAGAGGGGGGATGQPAVVQQVTGSTTSSANFTTSAVTTSVGNVLLLIAGRSGGLGTGSLTSVTDPVGNTWSKATTGSINGGTNTRVEVWYTTQNVGPLTSQAITANSGTSQSNDYSIIELSGVDRTAPVVASSPDGSGETSATPTTPAVTAGVNDFVLSVIHHAYNAAADTVSTAGWTLLTPSANGTVHLTSAAYQVESTAGSYGPTWSRGGAVSSGTGEITVSFKAATQVTYATETWTGTTGAAWPSQWTVGQAGATGSSATIQSNAGRLSFPTVSNYSFGPFEYLSGMTAATDFDLTMTVTFAVIQEEYLMVGVRSNATATSGYGLMIFPGNGTSSTVGIDKLTATGPTSLGIGDLPAGTWSAGVARKIRLQAIGGTLRCKVWDASASEPATWIGTVTDTTYTGTGKVTLYAQTGFSTSGSFVTLDDLTVTNGVAAPAAGGGPTPADTVGLTDAITVVQNENVSLTVNSVGVTDTASTTASVSRTAPDTVGLTDTVTQVLATVRAPADTVGLTDVFNATIYPPLSSLADPFNTADTTKWTFGPNATVANNRVSFATTDTTFSGYLTSVGRYTLIGSRATVRVPTVATSPDNQATTYFALYADNPNGNAVLFNVTGSALSFFTRVAGVQSTLASLTYDPVAHRWWRFTESIGNVVFQTSPDGVAWTTRATWTPTWDISGVFASVGAGTGASPTGATPAVFDSFNLPATAALTDDFATLDPTKWSVDRPGNASSVAGRLALVADSSFVNLYGTADADLTDSVVSGQLLPLPTVASGTVNFYLGIIDRKTTNNQLWIEVQNNNVSARGWEGSTATVVYSSPDWTALPTGVPSVLLRLRHSSATNTIYFEYSTDGTTWTTFGSRVGVPFDISQVYIEIGAGTVGAPSTPTVLFDNLNLPVFWYQKTAADTVGATDAVGKGFGRAPADNLGLTDTPSRTVGQVVSPADTVGTTDAVAGCTATPSWTRSASPTPLPRPSSSGRSRRSTRSG